MEAKHASWQSVVNHMNNIRLETSIDPEMRIISQFSNIDGLVLSIVYHLVPNPVTRFRDNCLSLMESSCLETKSQYPNVPFVVRLHESHLD